MLLGVESGGSIGWNRGSSLSVTRTFNSHAHEIRHTCMHKRTPTAYPTTDVPLAELPRTLEWFRMKVRKCDTRPEFFSFYRMCLIVEGSIGIR